MEVYRRRSSVPSVASPGGSAVGSMKRINSQSVELDSLERNFDHATDTPPSAGSAIQQRLCGFFGTVSPSALPPMLVTHLNIFIYALAFWLQQPVLPSLSKQLGADAATYGFLQSAFAGIQLIGGPLVGRISDVAGMRTALVLAQAASAASYLLLSLAWNVPMLLLSKLPSLLMHAMMAGQACVSSLSTETSRAYALGRLSLSYGLGMVLGSSVGGVLSRYIGLSSVAFVSGALSLAVIVPTLQTLSAETGGRASVASAKSIFSASELLRLFGLTGDDAPSVSAIRLRSIFVFAAVMGTGLSMQQATFSLVAVERFGLEPSQLGFVMSFVASLGVLCNMFAVGPLSQALGERHTCVLAALLAATAFVFYSQTSTLTHVLVIMAPMSLATSSLFSVVTASISKAAAPADLGSAIGMRHGLTSLLGVGSPMIAGTILQQYGFGSLALVCASTSAAAALVALGGSWGG